MSNPQTVAIPGSFNPLHSGHIAIYNYLLGEGMFPFFSLSTENADKPEISYDEADERASQFYYHLHHITAQKFNYSLIQAARFYDKVLYYKFSCTKFAVGDDTFERIIRDLKEWELEVFNRYGTEFIVFPRKYTQENPEWANSGLRYRFAKDFERNEVSSTLLRNNPKKVVSG